MGTLTDTTHLPLFQASFQVRGTVGGRVACPSGGSYVDWSLPENTLYDNYQELATAIQTALNTAIAGSWGVSVNSDGEAGITIGHGTQDFDLDVDAPLQDHLALPASTTSTSHQVSSTGVPPSGWWPVLPLTDDNPVFRRFRTVTHTERGLPYGEQYAMETDFNAVLHFTSGTVTQLRTFLDYVGNGVRFRLWVDRSVATAWTLDNRLGYMDLVNLDTRPSETWSNEPHKTYGTYNLQGALL